MALHVPREDANLIEVERQTIFGLGKDTQILRDFLVSILNLIQYEKCDDALAFRVLADVERDVELDHAGQHPSDTVVWVAHQPPVLDHRTRDYRVRLLLIVILRIAAEFG